MRRSLAALLLSLPLAANLTPARADVLIRIDKDAQRMAVSVNGQPRYSWPVSTGAAGYDTPNGAYRPQRMARTHVSREWDDAPMPYAIFFTGMGHAIHGTGHVSALGRPASHGCVRLATGKAASLFRLVKTEGMGATRIVVEGESTGIARAGSRSRLARGRGYEGGGVMSAGMQMGRDLNDGDAPVRRSRRRPAAEPFDGGYAPVYYRASPVYGDGDE